MILERFEPDEKLDITSDNLIPILSTLFHLDSCSNEDLTQERFEHLKKELITGGASIYRFHSEDIQLPSNIRASLNIVNEIRSSQEECMLWRLASFFRSNDYIVEFSSSDYYSINLYDKLNEMKYVNQQGIRFRSETIKAVLSDIFNGRRYIWIFPRSLDDKYISLICINDTFSILYKE